eukprot:31847_1
MSAISIAITLWMFVGYGLCVNVTNIEPKTWEINIDEPTEKRLKPLCDEYGIYAEDIYANMKKQVPAAEYDSIELLLLHWFNKNAVDPYRSEIEYISSCTNVTVGGMVFFNLLYDMTAGCTSIIAADNNNVIYHGRNLDYPEIPTLRNATYIGKYMNGKNELLYSGVHFFGYVGLWTGVKYNKFSLSGNERKIGNLVDNIYAIHDDYWPSGWLMREVIANATSFNDALFTLNNTKVTASVYYILGGTHYPEGAVITRDQETSYHLWLLNGTNTDNNYLNWYETQTNDDWWGPPADVRRNESIEYMNDMGRGNLNEMNLWNEVMSQFKVLNKGTIYTTIMSASNKSLCPGYTRIRYDFTK